MPSAIERQAKASSGSRPAGRIISS